MPMMPILYKKNLKKMPMLRIELVTIGKIIDPTPLVQSIMSCKVLKYKIYII